MTGMVAYVGQGIWVAADEGGWTDDIYASEDEARKAVGMGKKRKARYSELSKDTRLSLNRQQRTYGKKTMRYECGCEMKRQGFDKMRLCGWHSEMERLYAR